MELVPKDWMVNKYFSFFLSAGSDPGNATRSFGSTGNILYYFLKT